MGQINSLRQNKAIERIFQSGRYHYGKILSLRIIAQEENETRYLICPAKKTKNVVQKNKIKRITRHILQDLSSEIACGFDIACFPSIEILRINNQQRIIEFRKCLSKAGLLNQRLPEASREISKKGP